MKTVRKQKGPGDEYPLAHILRAKTKKVVRFDHFLAILTPSNSRGLYISQQFFCGNLHPDSYRHGVIYNGIYVKPSFSI